MARSAHLPIAADRYEACVRTIIFRGIDLRGVALRSQVRPVADTPGAPLVDLQSTNNGNAEGLRVVSFEMIDGLPVTTIEMVVNETTMEALPYSGEVGSATPLAYDLQATISGRKRKLLYGAFVVLPGVTGADAAPIGREGGYGGYGGYGGCGRHDAASWSSATLTFSDDKAEVSLAGIDLFDALAGAIVARQEATRAALIARAVLYGISDAAAARLFTATSMEGAFTEQRYRAGFADGPSPAVLPDWRYARAEAATAPTAAGLIQPFAPGTPRITDAGLRIEQASINSARPGNDFAAALWTKTGVTLAAVQDGPFSTATRVTVTSAGFHFVGQVMEQVGTVSCYAKAAGVRRLGIQIEAGGATRKAVYDLIDGVVIQADAGVTAWVDPGPLGFFRIVATIAAVAVGTVRIHALADDNADAFPADGTKAFLLACAQCEPGAIVTSYIDTATAPLARSIDGAAVGFSPSGDFTLFAEVDLRRSEGLDNAIVSLIGTTPNDRVMLLRDAAGRFAVEVANAGQAVRATGPALPARTVRCAISVSGGQVIAALQGGTILPLAATRPAILRTLWLGIRGTPEAALNGAVRTILAIPRAFSKEDLITITNLPRPLTSEDGSKASIEAVRQMITAHSNDLQVHGLPAMTTAMAVAASKEGIWTVAVTDGFTGTDGTPLGNTETGALPWVNPGNFQRVGGRAKQPNGAFGGAALDTAFSDGQIEADLYPAPGGEASLVFRSNTNFNQYMLLQRGGDGTIRLAYVFTQTELLSPLISLPVVAGERWKVRFVGASIVTYRIVGGVETLIHNVSDARLTANRRHGLRLNGASTVDNFRLLKRESL